MNIKIVADESVDPEFGTGALIPGAKVVLYDEYNKEGMMDYSCEKADPANLRDLYLPTPFSGADDFSVVGEGISGVFRAYSSKMMQYYPKPADFVNSNSGDLTFGVDLSVSVAELGISLTTGNTSYTFGMVNWNDEGKNDQYDFKEGEDDSYYYLRFKGDLGGYSSVENNMCLTVTCSFNLNCSLLVS